MISAEHQKRRAEPAWCSPWIPSVHQHLNVFRTRFAEFHNVLLGIFHDIKWIQSVLHVLNHPLHKAGGSRTRKVSLIFSYSVRPSTSLTPNSNMPLLSTALSSTSFLAVSVPATGKRYSHFPSLPSTGYGKGR